MLNRRYDIDWVRVIAIGLLLIYHVAIGFQPWGIMIGFIANTKSWVSLWAPMTMLNIWRIPLLFFVSGMGVYLALGNRNWKELMLERGRRILVPFIVGVVAIVPLHLFLWQQYYNFEFSYNPSPGHLWFLGNIFVYVMVLSPLFFYLKKNSQGKLARAIRWLFSNPLGLLVVIATFTAEAMVVKPYPYEMYALTTHGFILGLLAFFFGFCFVLSGDGFWNMITRWRWVFPVIAIGLFIVRLTYFQQNTPHVLLITESDCWIFSVLAFAHRYLNRPGKVLDYLSQAAYPVYILHMIFLYLGSLLIFKLNIAVQIQFVLVLVFTFVGCFAAYEVIRRVRILRPLFGLRAINN
jgi:glucans biosynthesis protein C